MILLPSDDDEEQVRSRSYFYCGFTSTYNVILNALSFGHYLWLEGRVRNGVFRNWLHRVAYRPRNFWEPTTEEEIIKIIRSSSSVRLFGAGHSFNEGVRSDLDLISLDQYSGVIKEDLQKRQLTVRAGTRVRDLNKLLLERGLAFKALPSHNAQSIGGILSTDVHGTGRDWGWVSEMVTSIKLIDGNGDVHVCTPSDDLFRAAVGGIGAVGVISDVTIQAVDRFNMEQTCTMADVEHVETHLDDLLNKNDHMSLYLFPFSNRCQINKWNHTNKAQSFLGPLREFLNISLDALASAWFGNFIAYTGRMPTWSQAAYKLKRGTDLVLESAEAYSRTIYHLHQELEFTIPYENTVEVCERFLRVYEEMYAADPKKMPYAFIEVRFTPAGHELTMIGPGRDRRSTYIDLIINDTHGFEIFYATAEEIIKEIGARPHLGKFCQTLDKDYLAKIYGKHFDTFLKLVNLHDPENKFANDFTRRLFLN